MSTPTVNNTGSSTPTNTGGTGTVQPTQTSEKDAKLAATRAKIIQAYSDSLQLQGDAKAKEIERFSKLLDPSKLELILYAKAGESGYMFKEDLGKLLNKLGGANSEKGAVFVNALKNDLGLNFGIPALLVKPTDAAKATAEVPQGGTSTTGSQLAVKASAVVVTQAQEADWKAGKITLDTLSQTPITKENLAASTLFTLSLFSKDATFQTLCPTFVSGLNANAQTKTLSELLTAAKQELSTATDTEKAKPYLSAIERLQAAEKTSTDSASAAQ